jgi:FkbM family methyltransferase
MLRHVPRGDGSAASPGPCWYDGCVPSNEQTASEHNMTLRHKTKVLLQALSGVRFYRELPHGVDLHHDLARLDSHIHTIIDVGANVGQAALRFREQFPRAVIHCFEPVRSTFAKLVKNVTRQNCHCHCCALGSHEERRTMYVRDNDTMSSLVRPADYASAEEVDVKTLDGWSRERAIESVDVLKIDAEGHDLEVLAGASRLLEQGAIKFVLAEVGFDETRPLVPCDAIMAALGSKGMRLVGFYNQTMDWGGKRQLLYADALFAKPIRQA